jgi:hypothetical protein
MVGVKIDPLCAGPRQRYLLAMKIGGKQIQTAGEAG